MQSYYEVVMYRNEFVENIDIKSMKSTNLTDFHVYNPFIYMCVALLILIYFFNVISLILSLLFLIILQHSDFEIHKFLLVLRQNQYCIKRVFANVDIVSYVKNIFHSTF